MLPAINIIFSDKYHTDQDTAYKSILMKPQIKYNVKQFNIYNIKNLSKLKKI